MTPPQSRPATAVAEPPPPPRALEPHDPSLFLNRELSWLEFDARVLEEARDASLPILERLKFTGIVSSNLDEFFMVRVAGLKQKIAGGVTDLSVDGLAPSEILAAVSRRTHALIEEQDRAWAAELRPDLERAGHVLVAPRDFTPEQAEAARVRFAQEVLPVLTPLAVDPGHPFPQLRNKSLNVALILRRAGRRRRRDQEVLLAVVQVPAVLPRLVRLPAASGTSHALLEQVIAAHAGDLFPGFAVVSTAVFRVTRNWDLAIDEEESEDLVSTVQEELRRRDRGAAVRLEIAADAADPIVAALTQALKLDAADVYRVAGPLQVQDLGLLADADPRPELRQEPHQPVLPLAFDDGASVIDVIGRGDVLLHHPYDSFEPVVRFVEEAAEDPDVLAIKHTLYRTSGDSPFVRALSRAAENGKQVTALVEIKARFDEANNIAWARRLEESGVHVVYGLLGLKTHCKVALVVRREGGKLRRYVHLGTGNYNPQTARVYTDVSLFSAAADLGEDVANLFNLLTGYAEPPRWKKLAVAPFGLQDRLVELVEREAQRARRGEPARIVAKMNALVDPPVIRALYAASQAGVEIDLLVRGICCLRPGVPGVSDRIRVTSIVDRFLEHARVFAFGAGDDPDCLLSSADWMPRNFHSRVEVMVPVEDRALKARLVGEVLGLALADTARARRLQPDGGYRRAVPEPVAVRSQQALIEAAAKSRAPAVPPVLRQVPAPRPAPVNERAG
ncbi:MAG TPA: polyphosphate kinase 1 [Anaeromyxobacteraceae bacterium]|nr:polyphosphate kinase 1 [Anaeromyxobacteraceae bacterium]